MIKIVYFDEESASDYLDITAGGKAASTSEDVRQRTKEAQAHIETTLAARLSWLPFLGASAEAGGKLSAGSTGQSILNKTLSNTILTDYLAQVDGDERIVRLSDLRVVALPNSMAYMKMFTPYMAAAKTEHEGVDLARLDEALADAKGYYELIGRGPDDRNHVLRFNLKAFRNNYGLADLSKMRLVFHGILVGHAAESDLSLESELSLAKPNNIVTADDVAHAGNVAPVELLAVYDILLAGVARGE